MLKSYTFGEISDYLVGQFVNFPYICSGSGHTEQLSGQVKAESRTSNNIKLYI